MRGKYQVSPDCTGSATFFFSDWEMVSLDLQILAERQEVQFIQTDAGTVITGAAKAQSHIGKAAAAEVHIQRTTDAQRLSLTPVFVCAIADDGHPVFYCR
jgi:hypothetical protein